MILIGQFDSPFTRRIGIMLRLYGIAFEHQPWSVFGDADKLAKVNPLMRVPTLVLNDGDVLIETQMIMDYLDRRVAAARSLIPQETPYRHRTQKLIALASGISDKAVTLFYETRLHDVPSQTYVPKQVHPIGTAMS
jgi:glutathione S-transferase